MIRNIKKLNITTILTSLLALGGLATPTIAQNNDYIIHLNNNQIMFDMNKMLRDFDVSYECLQGTDDRYRTIQILYARRQNYLERIQAAGIFQWSQMGGYTAKKRCEIISNNIQNDFIEGKKTGTWTKYSSGKINGHPVICSLNTNQKRQCQNGDEILFTLKPKDNPGDILVFLANDKEPMDKNYFDRMVQKIQGDQHEMRKWYPQLFTPYTKPLQTSQTYNPYSGSWSGGYQLDSGNPNSCGTGGQLQFTVDGQGVLRGILLTPEEKIQLNGVVNPDGSFVGVGNEGTKAKGNFSGNEFVGVYGNQTWGCFGRIGGRKF